MHTNELYQSQPYTKSFFDYHQDGSEKSAREIVPFILRLVQPQRVVDVGCGTGTWLAVFKESGVEHILGIDGDYVEESTLKIPKENFSPLDLQKPIQLDEEFDLVVSLEVAEHLPESCAETFVNSLTALGLVVLFSAAIPFQGGVHHINEQWPEYWVKLFEKKDYVVVDCIRKKVWQNSNVEWWYAQNTLLFVEGEYLNNHPLLKAEGENTDPSYLSIVHPRNFIDKSQSEAEHKRLSNLSNRSLSEVLSYLPQKTKNALKRRLLKMYRSS